MKKSILILAITGVLACSSFISCKSNSEKENDATEKVSDAKENLEDVKDDAVLDEKLKAKDAEWQTYKSENEAVIIENENRIAALKVAKNKPGTTFDASYSKSITALEDKNKSLKTRIDNYENNKTDWDSFKREFDSDMSGLGKALEDLGTNNKK
jgi:hypothetical protein